jgi:sugar/nucleoside kinase (ribokinase family)
MSKGSVVLSALGIALVWHVVRSARKRRAQGKPLVIAILGDTFVDVVAGPLEALPTWGTDTLVDRPIKLMLGGSGANLATHLSGAMQQHLLQTGAAYSRCVLHSAVGSDELGQFARQQLQHRQVALSSAPQQAGAGQATCLVLSVSQ